MPTKILRYKVISAAFGLCFVLVGGGVLWAYVALKNVSGPLILHYNSIEYITQIGDLRALLAAGVFGLIALLVNFILALELKEREWFLGELLAAGSVFMSTLIFIAFAAIISVN
jgi:hypothetical protein